MVRESSRRWIAVSAIAAVLALVAASPASHARTPAQTEVCGELTGATVWNAAESPYSVTCSVQIPADASLTVEPGVEARFGPDLELEVSGTLTINGSSPSDVVFTSNEGTPAKGDWRGIVIEEGAMADLRGLTVRWAGGRSPAIEAQGNFTLTDALIENMASTGIEIAEANAAISNTTIRDGTTDAIVHETNEEGNTLELSGVTIVDNAGAAVTAEGNVEVFPSDNQVSGNAINGIVVDGSVETEMTWRGGDMPYVIQRPVSIDAPLTIQPNTWIKSAEGRGLDVGDGGQIESGAADQPPVFFTSLGDDRCADDTGDIDCDTNNDGDTPQTPGSWGTVRV
ncbi:MAG: right-handed parallel beta-helix repeat-containing protein, partial [Halobacteriales archaeon]|nr:right-handed parallel beta-helix repeat-containing protein [Halobacteriales archaeon]